MDWNKLTVADVTSVIRVHNAQGKRLVMSGRRDSALIFPMNGRIRFSRNDQKVIADRTHPVLIQQGAHYVNECLESAESLMVNFVMTSRQDAWIEEIPEVDPAYAKEAFGRMQMLSAQKQPESRFALLMEMYRLLEQIFRRPPSEGERLLEPAIALMLERYADPALNSVELAKAANVSEAYLRKLFRTHLDTTPIRYLTGIRMEKARSLLREGRRVRETALDVGYGDIYQFSRAFRKMNGCTPFQYARDREEYRLEKLNERNCAKK